MLNRMNKQTNYMLTLLMVAGLMSLMFSCKEDEEPEPPENNTETTYEPEVLSCGDGEVEEVTVTDNGEGTGTTTWTNDKVYILNNFVFVNEGQTLTIEPGTIIKGKSGTGENAAALIVARGGKIMAEGTKDMPIVFTSEADKLNRDTDGQICNEGGNLEQSTRGLWGGLMVLGKSLNNRASGEGQIEGIPTTEPRGIYGGDDPEDNSGVLKYISIRHGGSDIGAGNEINGLTMGSVGNGTTVEYIEVLANVDDGIEWFGGTVNGKYLITTYCGDDALDYDEGYSGKNQFVCILQSQNAGDRGGEHDGGTDPEDGTPYATPKFYNVTSWGRNTSRTITFRDNAGGEYHNSIFLNYADGIDIEDLESGQDSKTRLDEGDLKIMNNIFDIAAADLFLDSEGNSLDGHENIDGNSAEDTGLDGMSGNLVPDANYDATGLSGDNFIEEVNYKGAFDANAGEQWYEGWTFTHQRGMLN